MTSIHRLVAVGIVWAAFALAVVVALMQSLFMTSGTLVLLIVVFVLAVLVATYLIMRVGPAR